MSNRIAFSKMIGVSELGQALIDKTDRGYNVLVGSTAAHPITFNSYAAHPHILNHQFDSTAAGLYQIIFPTWNRLVAQKGYKDFSPASQDAACIDLITGRGAIDLVDNGNFEEAVQRCCEEWASLPGGGSGQHQNTIEFLEQIYADAGGSFA